VADPKGVSLICGETALEEVLTAQLRKAGLLAWASSFEKPTLPITMAFLDPSLEIAKDSWAVKAFWVMAKKRGTLYVMDFPGTLIRPKLASLPKVPPKAFRIAAAMSQKLVMHYSGSARLETVKTPCDVLDVCYYCAAIGFSGDIAFSTPDGRRTLSFWSGVLRNATSSIHAERIGEMACSLGMLKRPELLDELERQRKTTKALGQLLISNGKITKRQLDQIISAHTASVLSRVLSFESVKCSIEPRSDLLNPPEICGKVSSLIFRAVRKSGDPDPYRLAEKGGYFVSASGRSLIDLKWFGLEAQDIKMLKRIDGETTMGELAREFGGDSLFLPLMNTLFACRWISFSRGPVKSCERWSRRLEELARAGN